VRSRRDQGYAIHMATQAVKLLFNSQGGKGLQESNPVQRAFRDLEAVKQHIVGNWDMPALNYGAVTLGLEPTDFFY
jgi:resorcinol 4-hydroxylase (FADH2)